jgi:TolB-like protein
LIIAGFLVVAARSGKSRRGGRLTDGHALPEPPPIDSPVLANDEPSGQTDDVVALLPPSDSETAKGHLGARPSVFLMPFDVQSEQEQDRRKADELHDDVITILSKSSDIAVIGRKAREWTGISGRSIRALGRELDARYAIIGDLILRDGKPHLAVHLLETATGGSVWSKNFSHESMNEIGRAVMVNQVAGHVAAEILRADAERTLRQEPERLSAESLTNRAIHSLTVFNRRTFHEIESLTRMAIDLKPNLPGAYGVLAGALALKAHQSWTASPEEDLEQAFSEGSRAVELSPANPRTLFWWGHVHLYGGRTDDAIGILENAVAGDTSYVPAHIALGAALILNGKTSIGIGKLQHALNLAPDHAQAYQAHFWLGMGHMELGDNNDAQQAFFASINNNVIKNPAEGATTFWAWIGAASSFILSNRRKEAEAILERLQDRFPDGDYQIMFDHAEASFAPHLQRLKMVTTIQSLVAQDADLEPPAARPVSLRDIFRRRASAESELG